MKSLTRGNFKAGIDSVRSAKLRSFWTMLGVIIGVASVISVVSIGEGVKQQVSGQIHHLGKDLITVRPAQLHTGPNGGTSSSVLSGLSVSGSLTTKDYNIVKRVPGVSASAPLTIVSGKLTGEMGTYNDGYVIGTTPDLASLLNQSVEFGAFIGEDDMGSNAAVLGQHAAQKIFDEDVPLGRSFTFHGQDFIVRGIFNEFSNAPLSQQADFNNAVFIPNDVAGTISNNTAPTYEVMARPANADQADAVTKAVQTALDKAHGGASSVSVTRGDQNLAGSDYILDLLTRMIAGVAAISLLVGGIGIMNVMQVSVAERMHEIGIRKAVGATNRQILNQFMVESSVISVLGGIIGIVVAVVIDLLLRLLTDLRPVISWQIVALATGVSLAVGIIFGSVPAIKAARKDPIDALRSE